MDDLIGCWVLIEGDSCRAGDVCKIIDVETENGYPRYLLDDGDWVPMYICKLLRTRKDWQVTDSDGTVWEAWESLFRYVLLKYNGNLCINPCDKEDDNATRQLCRAMRIPIQPWEVRKQWEDKG